MKELLVLLPLLLFINACAITGSAEDEWDREEKEDKISLDGILGKSKAKKTAAKTKAENDALRARIERLENGRQGGVVTNGGATNNGNANNANNASNGSVSFREWSSAREKGSSEYDEFKEYQKWLEFKKFKKNAQN